MNPVFTYAITDSFDQPFAKISNIDRTYFTKILSFNPLLESINTGISYFENIALTIEI